MLLNLAPSWKEIIWKHGNIILLDPHLTLIFCFRDYKEARVGAWGSEHSRKPSVAKCHCAHDTGLHIPKRDRLYRSVSEDGIYYRKDTQDPRFKKCFMSFVSSPCLPHSSFRRSGLTRSGFLLPNKESVERSFRGPSSVPSPLGWSQPACWRLHDPTICAAPASRPGSVSRPTRTPTLLPLGFAPGCHYCFSTAPF